MKNKKRLAVTVSACALVAALGIGGTLAYLTDRTDATNSFTFGDVQVDTLEPAWDLTDDNDNGVPDAAEDVVPNQQIPKSVQAENVGINDAVVFVKVTVPLAEVTRVSDEGYAEMKGDALDRKLQEIFYFQKDGDSINLQNNHFDSKWVNLPEEETGYAGAGSAREYLNLDTTREYSGDTRTYVFGYNTRLASGEKTTTLFDQVQIKNVIENEINPGSIQDIQIETYSIQADNIVNDQGEINTVGTMDHDTLKEIYDIYVTQNPDER